MPMVQLIHSKRYDSTSERLIYSPVTFSHNNVLKLQILICTNSYFLRKVCTVLQHNECGICNNLSANFHIHDTATLYLLAAAPRMLPQPSGLHVITWWGVQVLGFRVFYLIFHFF